MAYLPPRRFAFVATVGRAYRRVGPGLVFKSPLPFGRWLQAEECPLCFGEHGVFAYQPHRLTSGRPLGWGRRFATYAALADVRRSGHEIYVGGASFFAAVSARAATELVRALEEVRDLPAQKRAAWAEQRVAASLDVEAARAALSAAARWAWPLRVSSSVFTLVLFTALARVVVDADARSDGQLILAGLCLLPLWLLTIGHVLFAHRQERRDLPGERWLKAAMLVLAPATAGKVADWLTRDVLASRHWLVAARLLLAPEDFARLAGAALRELEHPGRERWVDPEPAARQAQEAQAGLFRRELARWLAAAGLDVEALRNASDHDEPGVVVRCPRCRAPYTRQVSACADCGAGISLGG